MGQVLSLRTGYQPEPQQERHERLVSKQEMARLADLTTRTLDNYVTRNGMPRGECWMYSGGGRKFYVEPTLRWIDEFAPRRSVPRR